jgi:DNA-binding response OmpR family regulator
MRARRPGSDCRYIVVADENRMVVNVVIETLLDDGHAVFQAYDGWCAVQLALGLKICDLVISNTRVGGIPGPELIEELRRHLPYLPILYLASPNEAEAAMDDRVLEDIAILHEPFTPEDLRAAVRPLLGPWPRLV